MSCETKGTKGTCVCLYTNRHENGEQANRIDIYIYIFMHIQDICIIEEMGASVCKGMSRDGWN